MSNSKRSIRIALRVVMPIAAVVAIGSATISVLADPAPAHADALCDQMRAQYGSNWPCISVPTNTFNPTPNNPAPTTGGGAGNGAGGPQVGSNIGPGPGEGNGTPIVPAPGQTPSATSPTPGTGAPGTATPSTPPSSTGQQNTPTAPPASPSPAPVAIPRFGYVQTSWWSPGCLTWHNPDGSCAGSGSGKQIMDGAAKGGTVGAVTGCVGGLWVGGVGCGPGAAAGAATGMAGGAVNGAWNAWG